MGSIFDGVMLNLKDDRVTNILVGAGAEEQRYPALGPDGPVTLGVRADEMS